MMGKVWSARHKGLNGRSIAFNVDSRRLRHRCALILEVLGVRCHDFDESLTDMYDPRKQILIVKDSEEMEGEEQNLPEEQSSQFQEQLTSNSNGGTPGWIDKLGRFLNSVNHGLGNAKPTLVPGPVPACNLRGVWTP